MQIEVTPLNISKNSKVIPAQISVINGQLAVASEAAFIEDEMIQLLSETFFYQGRGFPTFKKDKNSRQFIYDQNNKLILEGFVDLSEPDERILEAIFDHFSIHSNYQVKWINT